MEEEKPVTGEGSECTRPVGLFLSGEAFFLTARHAREALDAKELRLRFHMPVYYLYSHALELVLKAFLSATGFSEKKLSSKQFGHNLQKLWDKCIEEGLQVAALNEPFVGEAVEMLSPYATRYEFRYLQTGPKQLPVLIDVEQAVAAVMTAVKPHCEARCWRGLCPSGANPPPSRAGRGLRPKPTLLRHSPQRKHPENDR